ncbi:uncharacterized protein RJT21DRAFT_123218 [Scheffersomyces amazonensis]|uniref:uncharacterized protein n=1 Tax=Scheffersomyces amazonensis TaxID=1078765 RepID=UPI00315DCEB1
MHHSDEDDYSDEEFDETGIETPRSLRNDKPIGSFSFTRDRSNTSIHESVSTVPLNDSSKYTKYRSRNGTPLKQPPITSGRISFEEEEFEDDHFIRSDKLISPAKDNSKYEFSTPVKKNKYVGFSSPPSNLKFNTSIEIENGLSRQQDEEVEVPQTQSVFDSNAHVEELEFDSSDNEDKPKPFSTSLENPSTSKDHKLIPSPSHEVVVRSSNIPEIQESLPINDVSTPRKHSSPVHRSEVDVSRDSIIQRVNQTLNVLNQPTKKYPEVRSSPRVAGQLLTRSTNINEDVSSSLDSEPEFVNDFLLHQREFNTIKDQSPALDFQIDRSHQSVPTIETLTDVSKSTTPVVETLASKGWTAQQWKNLTKIVRSKSIKRREAINSTYLLEVLGCTKKELRQRYDFIVHLRQKRRRTTRKK